jgi:predicted acetyltransferase
MSSVPLSDAESALSIDQWAFGMEIDPDEPLETIMEDLDWSRFYGGYVPGPAGEERLAGVYTAYSTDSPLPGGGTVPTAALSWVGVHPRDRRRGVLSAMMRHHLDDVRTRRGEAMSILFAAEPGIYGRFGYGLATSVLSLEVPRGAALRYVPGSDELIVDMEIADVDKHAEPLARCFDAAAASRPGCISRPTEGTRRHAVRETPLMRRGVESLRLLTVSSPDGELRGYALFRRRLRTEFDTAATVEIREVITRDAAAAHALWSRLLDLDLTAKVLTPGLPPDDALLHLLVDARSSNPRMHDALWLRLVDLPAALASRRYATEVDAVLEVTDTLLPANAGRWHLRGSAGAASCTPTDAAPQLTLDVRELGSAYLGGTSLAALAAAGLLTVHDPEVLSSVTAAFLSPVAPWSAWNF